MDKLQRSLYWTLGICLAVTLIAHSPALQNGWTNWDDDLYVTQNAVVQQFTWADIGNLFTKEGMTLDTYTPLTILSFTTEHQMVGNAPTLYHVDNLLLHLLNTALVGYLIFLMFQNARIALIVGLLFGIHPAHVESVAWVTERKDLLFAFFFLMALVAYWKYLVAPDKQASPKRRWYVLAVVCFIASVLSKPQAISLPVILWLLDYWQKRSWNWRLVWDKLPFLGIAAFFVVLALILKIPEAGEYEFSDRFWWSSFATFRYVGMCFFPFHLSAYHPFPVKGADGQYEWIVYASFVIMLMIAVAGILAYRKYRVLFLGVLFFLFNIGHTLHFFKVNSSVFYERFTYLSYIGLFMIVAWLINKALEHKQKVIKYASTGLAVIVGLLFMWMTFVRTQVWQNSETLWTDVLKTHPDQAVPWIKRGTFLVQQEGRTQDGIQDLKKGLSLNATDLFALNNVGMFHFNQHQFAQALSYFDQVIKQEPGNVTALMNRALCHMNLAHYNLAQQDFDQAIQLEPSNALLYINQGFLFRQLKNYPAALQAFVKATQLDPGLRHGWYHAGIELFHAQQFNQAIAMLNNAISINPQHGDSYYWRSRCYEASGQRQKAVQDALQAQSLGTTMPPEYLQALQSTAVAPQ